MLDPDDPLLWEDDDEEAIERQPPAHAAMAPRVDAGGVPCRFFLFPSQPHWEHQVAAIGVGATAMNSSIDWWQGGLPVPRPPDWSRAGALPWLIPTSEQAAGTIAHWQEALRAAGWLVPESCEELVAELGSKQGLHERAARLGLLDLLPTHYASPSEASYPCIVKPSDGCAGRGVQLLASEEDARAHARLEAENGFPWGPLVYQEWVSGVSERSTSMVLREGRVVASVTAEYQHDRPDYCWPQCHEVARRFHMPADSTHLRLLERFLAGFSGLCNCNYKLQGAQHQQLHVRSAKR